MGFSQKNLDIEAGSRIIVHAVEQGINFLDTAQYYDTYRYLRPALDEIRQRDLDFPIICSKTLEEGYAETEAAVLECLEQLDIDAVDLSCFMKSAEQRIFMQGKMHGGRSAI